MNVTFVSIVGRYERHDRTTSVEIARKMALALDVFLDYLAGNTDLKLDGEYPFNCVILYHSLPKAVGR